MKALIACLVLSPTLALASTDLNEFCKTTYKDTLLSKEAVNNKGQIKTESQTSPMAQKKETLLEYYRGCRHDVSWMQKTRELICDNEEAKVDSLSYSEISSINAPKGFFFFFDGAGQFNGDTGKVMGAANLDGSEGKDLMGNSDGANMLMSAYGTPTRGNVEFHYHASSGMMRRENYASAKSCAQQINSYIKTINTLAPDGEKLTPKWVISGYSNGGALTLQFQTEMAKELNGIDLVLTLDPIEQAVGYMFGKLKKTIGKKSEDTKRLVNIYQNSDVGSMAGFQLRSRPVDGATKNIYVAANSDKNMSLNGDYNHIYVLRTSAVLKTWNCELNRTLLDKKMNSCKED